MFRALSLSLVGIWTSFRVLLASSAGCAVCVFKQVISMDRSITIGFTKSASREYVASMNVINGGVSLRYSAD